MSGSGRQQEGPAPHPGTTPATAEARARAAYDENPLRYASEATDYGWSVITGACGGCGSIGCHEGPCTVGVWDECDRCPERSGGAA
jgi:hypothetical protein